MSGHGLLRNIYKIGSFKYATSRTVLTDWVDTWHLVMLHGSVWKPIEIGINHANINEWSWLIAQSFQIGSLTCCRYLKNRLMEWVHIWHSDGSVRNAIEMGIGDAHINEWALLIAQSLKIGLLVRYLKNH